MSRRAVTLHAFLVAVGTASLGAAAPQGRLIVKVSDADNGVPIPCARVFANVGIIVNQEDVAFSPERLTDENGKCELPVPWGNLRLPPPIMPPGYWPVTDASLGRNPLEQFAQLQQFVVTRERPVVEKHFTAKWGVAWPIKVVAAAGVPLKDIEVHASRSSDRSRSLLVTDAAGQGRLTLPVDGGKLSIAFNYSRLNFLPRQHARMEIDADFNPLAIARQNAIADGTKVELVDRQGRKAVWEGCSAEIKEGAVELVFIAEDPASAKGQGEFVGTVVDHQGKAISGAYVRGYAPGVDLSESLTKTDERGEFRFCGLSKTRGGGEPGGIHLIVKEEGYAGIVANHLFVPNADGLHRLDTPLVLEPGHSFRVQVFDERDQPLEGAWIESSGRTYFLFKSDEWGRCVVRDVPAGPLSFRVSYGELRADGKVEVGGDSATQRPVVVRLAATDKHQPTRPERPTFPKVGELAPEWTIREWSDGREHTLASLRGRVVVIDFWALSCTPCRQITLPVENELRQRFDGDVTFIHVHPAGTEPTLIKELLAVQKWDLLVGVDAGASASESETGRRYGVWGYPTEVIIDREGRIAYHSSDAREDREELAADMRVKADAIGLPWPIEKDADHEELVRRLRRYHEYSLTREIERVLAK